MCTAGDKNCLLRARVPRPILSSPSRELIVFVFGETRPIACFVHVALAPRRAVREADPRFSRLVALVLANQMVASRLGIEARSSRGLIANASVSDGQRKKNGEVNSPPPACQTQDGPHSLHGECGSFVFGVPRSNLSTGSESGRVGKGRLVIAGPRDRISHRERPLRLRSGQAPAAWRSGGPGVCTAGLLRALRALAMTPVLRASQ
jgi:hypothetical protein